MTINLDTSVEAVNARTDTLLKQFRKNPDEFAMLKGVLAMDTGMMNGDALELTGLFNMVRVADRMDELIAEQAERLAQAIGRTG